MKKNLMMRAASVLLVAVMLTTCAISGTFAKYTTQDAANDSARVAKWGVELQVIGNLFGEDYGTGDLIVKDGDASATVVSNNTSDVVAPGTKNNEGFTLSLKGQPEVDGTITSTMTIQNIFLKEGTYGVMIPVDSGVINDANYAEFFEVGVDADLYYKASTGDFVAATGVWANDETHNYYTLEDDVDLNVDGDNATDDAAYYPVVYTLAGNTEYTTGDYKSDSLAAIADLIATQLGITAGTAAADTSVTYTGTPKTFEANTDLASLKLDGLNLKWSWAYDYDGCGSEGDAAGMYCKADTILGLLNNTTDGTVVKLSGDKYVDVEVNEDYCLNTQFDIDITVTQKD